MLPAAFTEIINETGINSDEPVLLAVSGGIDSVVLSHLAAQYFTNISIAHVNFGLRGEESDLDQQFVHSLASGINATFFTTRFDTKNYAGKRGISIQLAARELRYQWMNELMEKEQISYLLTAHHLDDSFETALYNLVKGTGISGLRGIKVINGKVFRPLLTVTRNEIENYALSHQLTWREDRSNSESKYSRNFIRNRVVPLLRKINPSLTDTFRSTQLRLADTERLLLHEAESRRGKFRTIRGDDIIWDLKAFSDHNLAVSELLLADYGCNFTQVRSILEGIRNNEKSSIFYTDNFILNLDRETIIISPHEEDYAPLKLRLANDFYDHPLGTVNCEVQSGNSPILGGGFSASLDFEKLKEPLVLRKWAYGDRFVPLGMKGKKKISDFMIDEKIPLNLKKRVCVLESAGEIAWLAGYRISDKFKVTNRTKTRFNITIDHDKSV